jgi:hypothetical protein
MNYGDYSYIEPYPNGSATQDRPVNFSRRSNLFEIWIRPISMTAPGTLHQRTLFATRAAWRELDKLVANGLPEDQIERTRRYLHDFTLNYGSTVSRRLSYAVDDVFYGLGPGNGYLESIRPALAALDKATVDAAVEKHLGYSGMYVVFITSDAEAVKELILSGRPTPITYAGQQPPEVLQEDIEIAAYPIEVAPEDIRIMDISEVFEHR